MEAMGIKQQGKFLLEIKGKEGDKCVIYEKVEDYKFEFTDEFVAQMSSYGMAEADIQKQLEASEAQATQLIGKDLTCKIPMSQLASSLSDKGLSPDASQCTGSLLTVTNSLIPKDD